MGGVQPDGQQVQGRDVLVIFPLDRYDPPVLGQVVNIGLDSDGGGEEGEQPCCVGGEADGGDPDGSLGQQGEEVEAGGAGWCWPAAGGGGGKGRGGGVGGVLGTQFLPLLLGNHLFTGFPLLDPPVLLEPDLLAPLGLNTGLQTILPGQTGPYDDPPWADRTLSSNESY